MTKGGRSDASPPLETPIAFVSAASSGVFFEIYKKRDYIYECCGNPRKVVDV
jgi:hypothetical protein